MDVRFVVEGAGCESCARRVREALEPLLEIASVNVDEADDTAAVVARADTQPSVGALDAALAEASEGAGHAYRVRPGSLDTGAVRPA